MDAVGSEGWAEREMYCDFHEFLGLNVSWKEEARTHCAAM